MKRAIVAAAVAGDADAFASIVEEFTPTVTGAAFGLCGDRELATDIAQEVFATAFAKVSTLRDPDALAGWLMAITRSAARVARRPPPHEAADAVPAAGLDDQIVAADEARRARRAVEALPANERLLMALHYFAGRPLAEIAELCDLPLSTVKKRMRVARARIAQGGPDINTHAPTHRVAATPPTETVGIFAAVRTGDPAQVGAILDARPDLVDAHEAWSHDEAVAHRLPPADGGTPLLRAVERGDRAIVETLLGRGADPDGQCSCAGGENPVWVATAQDDSDVLQALLASGADPDRPAFAGLRPIEVALVRGYDEIAEMLAAAGVERDDLGPSATIDTPPGVTGIRAIDLWCPLPERGLVHLAAGYRLGAVVLLAELSWRAAQLGERVVWTGFLPTPLDLGDIRHGLADAGIGDQVTLALADHTADDRRQAAAFHAGLEAARRGGLLIVFSATGQFHLVEEQFIDLAGRDGTTIIVSPLEDPPAPPSINQSPYLASVRFDEARAARGRWPAISATSWSAVATPAGKALARRARQQMTDEVDDYLSQPFHVTEHIRSVPGESTDINELHARVAALLDGGRPQIEVEN